MNKVVKFYKPGSADVLKIESEDILPPREGEARIAISAIGLNRFEIMFREDNYAISPEFPSRLGGEAVGIVEALGPNTNTFQVGDRVTVLATLPMSKSGVYAERTNVPVTSLVRSVDSSTDVDEAALWLSYITVYGPFIEYSDIQPGQSVLITAASSSVGLAAIQVVKDRGGVAIATTRTSAKRQALLKAGADQVIATEEEDLLARVQEMTKGNGVDIAFDAIGGKLLPAIVQATAVGGRIYEYGFLDAGGVSGSKVDLPLMLLFSKMLGFYSVFEIMLNPARMSRAEAWLRDAVRRGAVTPRIDKTFRLNEIVAAHQYMESGQQLGKIVVLP
ncbi:zinc-dependent alcohol dehydrogenase family protein [Leptolyngbya sp. FACHB-671]|uniref:zinc-dependent alcohol dehydrogenase family protein n=1 Tax=Leptolyngbya sp. FACHB-671 TaxID=2692812 RepID=UPI001681E2ED|nr:zinc-dependent alcohol dehydrogenase family protein [Leptolyngbya sp. FACHB-671]MBD1870649.1 zinc-dependent alcohol dehydrogenase family protein [Cyanobacteria bacterium FACHB-471]MBD2070146.1 zinc-dependent alcohol dehydrogenase family protein [Leptolyngbya sp. FACHB-671]